MDAVKLNKRMPVSAMLDPKIVIPAVGAAVAKLDPRLMIKNPVMFVVEIVAALTTVIFLKNVVSGGESLAFTFQIILWLWFTVLFANFAEAVAEGRGKAQAESLRKTRTESQAKLLTGSDKAYRLVSGTSLKVGDIVLVEAGERQKTPNEIALNILLAGLTIIFVFATVTIPSYAAYAGGQISVVILVALFVTLIPTTIGALLSAIGIAGMDRLVRFNVLAMSGRAVEAAGDVDTLLLDKTGTITLGNRQATAFRPVRGVSEQELADAAQIASLADETPEGRSIVVLAKEKYGIRGRDLADVHARFIPFTAQSRMSGVETGGSWIRKGAVEAILGYLNASSPVMAISGAVAVAHAPVSTDAVREITAVADVIA